MAGQLADYDIIDTVLDNGTVLCLNGRRPARLGPGPVTLWVLGPVARSPWAAARPRLEQAAAVRAEGLPDWLESGVADWGQRPVVWVSSADNVSSTLASAPAGMPVAARLAALAQAARGAHALHERGVLHGAVCPQAVGLVSTTPDQGTAGGHSAAVLAPPALADGQRLTVQVGYPPLAYVDPQLLRGEGGRWSDIWALGATLHQVVTGRPPYPGLDDLPVVQALSQMLVAPPGGLTGVPPAALGLVAACLSLDPAARPATAAEVARRTDELAAQWEVAANG